MHIKLPLVALACALGGSAALAVSPLTNDTVQEEKTDIAPLNFERMDSFLSQIVFDVGRSEHKHVAKPRNTAVGSNIRSGSAKGSWTEGNRIPYSRISEETKAYVSAIKQELEAVIQANGLGAYSEDDMLAFLLNMHTITVIQTVMNNYPITDVSNLIEKKKDGSAAWDAKTINFGRTQISLRQLEGFILKKWADKPLVIYGLHRGAIGSPNLRPEAYKGAIVWKQLDDNAREFVNSIRGTEQRSKTLRVSKHYMLAKRQFPDFEKDLRAHLFNYLDEPSRSSFAQTTSIKAMIEDWSPVDMANGRPNSKAGGGGNSIGAGVSNAGVARWGSGAKSNLPPHTIALVQQVQERKKRLEPKVRIEKVGTGR